MKHNFEEHKQNRIENAKKQAEKNKQESGRLYKQAHDMASFIPFGQPILVGHHSEKRDRNYRNRIHNTFGKSFEKQEKAEYYEDKAKTIENNDAIFSDDPDALEKLQNQLNGLIERQEFMKAANICIKKQDKDGFLKLKYATEEVWRQINTPDYLKRTGYPSYKLTNNGANIRRIKQRIAQLEREAERPETEISFNGGSINQNKEANRIQIIFESKPNELIRQLLKKHGFRWSPSQSAWQRHLNANGIYAAKEVLQQLNKNNSEQ